MPYIWLCGHTACFVGDAFVRETCLLAANISHIIGEPSSEQQRYLDYAAGTLSNFTQKFFNSSAGICETLLMRHTLPPLCVVSEQSDATQMLRPVGS